MGQLVLLVVAAAWAAVLVPPLLRSRIENRPNSSVSDFRDQLSSLQRAMPSRGVAMRSMGRPLAQSPLSRPAAAGRPGVRGGRTHSGSLASAKATGTGPGVRRRPEPVRTHDGGPRVRSHAEPTRARTVDGRDVLKRRRANVLKLLVLTTGCTLFLAATTQTPAMVWLSVVAIVALLGYVCLLGQLRQRDLQRELRTSHAVAVEPARRPRPVRDAAPVEQEPARDVRRRPPTRRHDWHTGPVRRQSTTRRRPVDRYSAAV